jgi:hypothetical protein
VIEQSIEPVDPPWSVQLRGSDAARPGAVAGSDTVMVLTGPGDRLGKPRPLRSFAARFEFDTIRLRSRTTFDVGAVSVERDRAGITRPE